jgi:HlyD family secretion protein
VTLSWANLKAMAGAHWRVLVAILFVAAALAYGLGRQWLGPVVPAYAASRRDVVETVVASGRVAAPFRVDIGSQVTGTVKSVPVSEGQAVKAGQPLVELDDAEARASMLQAQVAVAQAQARLRQLGELQFPVAEQSLRQAEANRGNARAQYERNQRLFESGFIGQAALDDAKRNLDVAETQVESARRQVETARPTGSDHAIAATALEQARASLDAARARLGYMVIRAPRDGTLIARNVEHGDVVQPGKALMVLSPAGETQLVLEIDERNLSKLRIGQRALASADAYATQRFAAELVFINPGVDAQRGTLEVKLRVPDPPEYLRQDMTVSVDIEVGRRTAALTVPTDAVRNAVQPSPWVLKVVDGRVLRQPVRTGLRGERFTEVLQGLAEGDLVLAGKSAAREGQRVRPERRE